MADDPATCVAENVEALLSLTAPRASGDSQLLIRRAYDFAEARHCNQTRSSGEPYIQHPLAVAATLACLRLDAPTIAAALLHDVMEDCGVTADEMRAQFGDEITRLVDAVTKLSKREGLQRNLAAGESADDKSSDAMSYRNLREAESLRKMFLGISDDVRVVLIKLADRLHNMRTLGALKPEKQRRIARETLDVFAPLANRLGMWEWKQQLEELAFRYAEPVTYADIVARLEEGNNERSGSVGLLIQNLRQELAARGITNVTMTGRAKQIYSIWRKMQRKRVSFDQIMDLRAIRVIVEDGSTGKLEEAAASGDAEMQREAERMRDIGAMQCYNVLYVVHNLWRPIASEFDDYISRPKNNHYQSLHTAVIANDGRTLEVQIRTRSMHQASEYGVAAHWLYKESGLITAAYQRHLDAYREDLRNLGTVEDDAEKFVSAAVRDSENDASIYCFTPRGKLIELPRDATVLDFAFQIHTELGYKCRGAKVNGAMRPITYKLQNDDQVEILTNPNGQPSRDWLYATDTYVTTESAKAKVKLYFRKLDRNQHTSGGREAVERELRRLDPSGTLTIDDLFKLYGVDPEAKDKVEDFLASVGAGSISMQSISSRILVEVGRRERERKLSQIGLLDDSVLPSGLRKVRDVDLARRRKGWVLEGTHDVYGEPAGCCNPLPGEDVVGYVSLGQGVKVHSRTCKNVVSMDPGRLFAMHYIGEPTETYPIEFLIQGIDQPGLLTDCSSVLSEGKINIIGAAIMDRDQKMGTSSLWFKVELRHTNEAFSTMSKLRRVRNVLDVKRVAGYKPRMAKEGEKPHGRAHG